MRVNNSFLMFSSVVMILLTSTFVSAEVPKRVLEIRDRQVQKLKEEEKAAANLPKSGILSQTMQAGTGSVSMQGAWGSNGVTGGSGAPIGGSINKVDDFSWKMFVANGSDDDYRVVVRVIQYDENGKKVASPSYTLSLKAGKDFTRTLRISSVVKNCTLELVNWKNLSEEQRKKEAAIAEVVVEDTEEVEEVVEEEKK